MYYWKSKFNRVLRRSSSEADVREASEIHTFLFGGQSSTEIVKFFRGVFKYYTHLVVCC